jgi:hypothetical protein
MHRMCAELRQTLCQLRMLSPRRLVSVAEKGSAMGVWKAVAAITLVLSLVGCGGESTGTGPTSGPTTAGPESTPPPAQRITGPGTYTFKALSGGTGTLQVPGAPNADIEELRPLVGAPAVTYISAAVDNRQGSAGINMYSISIFTPAGQELEYKGAHTYVDELGRGCRLTSPLRSTTGSSIFRTPTPMMLRLLKPKTSSWLAPMFRSRSQG